MLQWAKRNMMTPRELEQAQAGVRRYTALRDSLLYLNLWVTIHHPSNPVDVYLDGSTSDGLKPQTASVPPDRLFHFIRGEAAAVADRLQKHYGITDLDPLPEPK